MAIHDPALLEKRLVEIRHVIDDHVAPRRRQRPDIGGELRLADHRAGKVDAGARRHLVHQLRHRPPLVGRTGRPLLQNGNPRRQRPVRHIQRRAPEHIETVRQNPDDHPGTGDPERRPRHIRLIAGHPPG